MVLCGFAAAQTLPGTDGAPGPKVHRCEPLAAGGSSATSPPTPLDEGLLNGLVGKYQFLPDLLFIVTRQGDRLFAALGEDRAEMLPQADGRFLVREAELHLVAQRGADGRAICLVAQHGGETKPMPRVD